MNLSSRPLRGLAARFGLLEDALLSTDNRMGGRLMHKDAFSVDDLGTGATPDKKLKAIRMSEDLLPRLAPG